MGARTSYLRVHVILWFRVGLTIVLEFVYDFIGDCEKGYSGLVDSRCA